MIPTNLPRGLVPLVLIVALAPAPAAADDDPVPDGVELLLCGFADVRNTLAAAPDAAGRCVSSSDYANPAFSPPTGCGGCTTRSVAHEANRTLAPAVPLPPDDVQGVTTPDHAGTPPIATPPVGAVVATLVVCDSGSAAGCGAAGSTFLCVDVVLAGSPPASVPIACVNRNNLGSADPFVQRGSTPLLVVDPVDVPPTDPRPVPDVEPVPEGSLGSTPRLTVTLDAKQSYDPSRVTQGGSLLGRPVYQPFLPGDAGWFLMNGVDLGLTVKATVYRDGAPLQSATVSAPWLGQALAAAQATAGTPP